MNGEELELEALENFAPAHWHDVLLDGPWRAEQIAHLQQIVRDLRRLGIKTMGYNFSIAGVFGRTEGPFARGGARSVGFHDPTQPPIPNGMVWNMVYNPERFESESPRETVGTVTADQVGGGEVIRICFSGSRNDQAAAGAATPAGPDLPAPDHLPVRTAAV